MPSGAPPKNVSSPEINSLSGLTAMAAGIVENDKSARTSIRDVVAIFMKFQCEQTKIAGILRTNKFIYEN